MSTTRATLRAQIERIEGSLPDWSRDSEPEPPEGYREAAVSLVLRAVDQVELLLIRRSKSDRDPWSGHMALPGGRRESGDPSLLYTAMRETLEETAVELATSEVLGTLELVAPSSERLPRLSVVPFVFGREDPVEAIVNSYEVASVTGDNDGPAPGRTTRIPLLPGGRPDRLGYDAPDSGAVSAGGVNPDPAAGPESG